MNKLLSFVLCLQVLSTSAQKQTVPLGHWKEYLSNNAILQLVQGDVIYGASSHQVFSMDANQNIEWYGKSNGFSETEVKNIAWDAIRKQLVIAYKNGTIDIQNGDQVYGINDLTLSSLYSTKNINHLNVCGNWALLSTSFGIVVIDLTKHEIKDTWFPNNNRQRTITYQTEVINDTLYVLTEDGLWMSPLINNYLSGNQWTKKSEYDILNIKHLATFNHKLLLYNENQLYVYPDTTPLIVLPKSNINFITSNTKNIFITIKDTTKGRILQLNDDGTVLPIQTSIDLKNPTDLLFANNLLWIADTELGLIAHSNKDQIIDLKGPKYPINGTMSIDNTHLLIPYGESDNETIGFSSYSEEGWNYYKINNKNELPAFNHSAINRNDGSNWLTHENKIFHFSSNFEIIDSQKLELQGNIQAIEFTNEGNGWILQDQKGIWRFSDNKWSIITPPANFQMNGLGKMAVNNKGQIWMIAPDKQGLYVFQSDKVYNNKVWIQKTTSSINGNLPSNNVTSICVDKTEAIWVGTNNGIGILQCNDISQEACNAYLPIIKSNGFNGYLFQKEAVHCIQVDGANRKWVGTNNGAWLLSADGLEIIEHFTKSNSPLINDTILQICISPKTGEVFFLGGKQLISYSGSATEGMVHQNNILIFPNPVPPNFSGLIGIRGVVKNGWVKVTDLNGKLVFETRALGGQAVWNGRTYEGNKLATGIYLVFIRDESGNEKAVGKIIFTNGN